MKVLSGERALVAQLMSYLFHILCTASSLTINLAAIAMACFPHQAPL